MGYDNFNINNSLIQVGNAFQETRDNVTHVTTRISHNSPIIEKSLDRLGTLYTYRLEFYTYTNRPTVSLDIEFLPKFISQFYMEG